MRVRLWTWWDGPTGPVPPGVEITVDPAEGHRLCSAGQAEMVPEFETAVVAVAAHEAAVLPRQRRTRKAKRR